MQKSVLHESQKLPTFDQVGREFLMQDRHERDLTDSAMLGPAFQTSRVMENLHDKFTLFQTQTFLHLITYEVVQISEPNMRAQMMQTDVGKETGVELHSDNVLKNMFDIEHFIPAALLAKVDAVLESSIPFYTTESEELKAVRGY